MTNKITTEYTPENPFQEIADIGNARLTKYCKRFEDGWFEKLIQLWESFYVEKYSAEITDSEHFKKDFHDCIQWYWDYLSKKISWDKFELYDKAGWIESKYKELLLDENYNWPKNTKETVPKKPNLAIRRLAKKVKELVSGLVPKH